LVGCIDGFGEGSDEGAADDFIGSATISLECIDGFDEGTCVGYLVKSRSLATELG